MIFLLLLVGFSYVIHKMCSERGISPWSYLVGFVSGFFLILFATSAALVLMYGQNVINDPEVETKVMAMAPFAMLFQFLLFVFFRVKIGRTRINKKDDEDTPPPPPAKEKKDLSYFR